MIHRIMNNCQRPLEDRVLIGQVIRLLLMTPANLHRKVGQNDRDEINANFSANDITGMRIQFEQDRRTTGVVPFRSANLADKICIEQLFDQS